MDKPSIVFFGNERLATGVTTNTPTLRALIAAGYEIKAVVANFVVGTSRSARQLEIQTLAAEHNIPVLLPSKTIDIINELREFNAEVAVLAAYGKIVPQDIIDVFPGGIINIHPSLLPLHRGSTPIESVILSGEAKTGVSIMKLVKAMDAGPVFGQSEVLLKGNESKQYLADELAEIGSAMLVELLPGIIRGEIVAAPQDDSSATYDTLISKDDCIIDYSKPALQIEKEIRAYAGWPKSSTKLAGIDVIITSASVTDDSGDPGTYSINGKDLIIYCAVGALNILELKPIGKNSMSAESFIAGYKDRLI